MKEKRMTDVRKEGKGDMARVKKERKVVGIEVDLALLWCVWSFSLLHCSIQRS